MKSKAAMQNRYSLALYSLAFYPFACMLWLVLALPAHAQAGWKTEVAGKSVVLTPPDLAAGEFYQITITPRVPMQGAKITTCSDRFADRWMTTLGSLAAAAEPAKADSPAVAVAHRIYIAPHGEVRGAVFVALSVNGKDVRVIVMAGSGSGTAVARHQSQANALVEEMRRQDQAGKATAAAKTSTPAVPYPYRASPGKGVQTEQIAGILHHFDLRLYSGGALNESYLLLRDGAVYKGLLVPPDEFNAPLSRRREPEKWGHWKRQGAAMLAAWPRQPDRYTALQGVMAIPGKPGERMNRHFAMGESSGAAGLGGYYQVWGVRFTPDGRFQKDGGGGSSSGSLGQVLNGFSVNTQYDHTGSSASVSSPGSAGYSASRRRNGSAQSGTYTVSPYALTLHYDNGVVERRPFFFLSDTRDVILFEGDTLGPDAGS